MAKKFYTYTLAYPESMGGTIFYVGKGTGRRVHQHETDARAVPLVKSHKNNAIRKIWAAGEQVAKRKEAYFATEEEAFMHEIALIVLMRPYGNLTNLTDGGEGISGLHHSEAARQKIGESSKTRVRKPLSEAARQRISDAGKGRSPANKGKHPTEATLQKLKDRGFSEEHRKNIGLARKGQRHTEAALQKMKGRVSPNKGKPAHNKGKRTSKYVPQNADMTDEEYQRELCRLNHVRYRQRQRLQKENKSGQLSFEGIAS